MIRKITILSAFAIVALGCTNDSTDDLIGEVPTETITYNEHVRTIINNNCIICHGTNPANGAPMSLTTYENVREAIINRGLIDRISREQGAQGMMPNGGTRLPQNLIDIIIQWEADGLQQ